jgi:hypothetical protein
MRGIELHVRWVAAILFAACIGTVHTTASAQPATANVIQIGAGAQYGINLKDTKPNPWQLGLGLGVGYTLPAGLYAGAQFEYFFGGKDTVPGPQPLAGASEPTSADVEANLWDLFAEVGYDLGLGGGFVLRGKGDVGMASLSSRYCVVSPPGVESYPCEDDSETALLLGPGAAFLYLGPKFSFSLEARYDFVLTSPNAQGLIFALGIGF